MLEIEAANTGKVLIVGHRGARGHAPENTMPSFQIGYELGDDLLETDIQMSRDGALVLMHDPDVSRSKDGTERIKDMDLKDIRALDAGSRFDPRFRGAKVPVLGELLKWSRNRIPLVIEIKGDPQPAPGIEQLLLDELRANDLVSDVMVISFYHDSLRRLKDLEPSIATGIIFECQLVDTVQVARASGANAIRPHWSFLTPAIIAEVHAAGIAVHAWMANDETMAAYLADMGVDSLGVDFPDRVRPYLDRVGKSWKH
ncbi:MAG: glycerophosphodiester phosphodiesterase family protein [Spirochaetota bacterium]